MEGDQEGDRGWNGGSKEWLGGNMSLERRSGRIMESMVRNMNALQRQESCESRANVVGMLSYDKDHSGKRLRWGRR